MQSQKIARAAYMGEEEDEIEFNPVTVPVQTPVESPAEAPVLEPEPV